MTSKRVKRERARRFDPHKYPADLEFMQEFLRQLVLHATASGKSSQIPGSMARAKRMQAMPKRGRQVSGTLAGCRRGPA